MKPSLKKTWRHLMAFTTLSVSLSAAATAEPVDKNESGAFAGGKMSFGQAYATKGDQPGMAYFLSATGGYIGKRDTWNRTELGLELGTGRVQFREKSAAGHATMTLPINFFLLAKAGYGYSLGEHAFGIMYAGLGPFIADANYKQGGTTYSSDSLNGLVAELGYEAVFPVSDKVDFFGGISWRMMNVSIDEVSKGGQDIKLDETYQINAVLASFGARARF